MVNKPQKRKKLPVWALVLLLFAIIGGTTLFICAVAGIFGPQKVSLSPEYYAEDSSLTLSDGIFLELLTPERLAELENSDKTFAVFVDQTDCINADRLRGFLTDYTSETGLKIYRIMFSDLKNTDLNGQVKYYPSVAIISNGKLIAWLNANSDADADAYNSYDAFKTWLETKIK